MAERLTKKIFDETGKQQDIYEWSSVSSLKCNRKLGKLEDILEKYNIDSVEELEKLLDDNKYAQNVVVKQLVELQNAKTDRDAWKRACELACGTIISEEIDGEDLYDVIEKWKVERDIEMYGFDDRLLTDYFYQQAKTEGNDEK